MAPPQASPPMVAPSPFPTPSPSSPSTFRQDAHASIEWILSYFSSLSDQRVVADVQPGFLTSTLPSQAPVEGESFSRVLADFDRLIMPGVTHWLHPRFHAYFPAGASFPSLLATILGDSLGTLGFSWASCPSMTELETVVMEWYGSAIGLPPSLLPLSGTGGGALQGSASDCTLVALLAARAEALRRLHEANPEVEECAQLSKLVAYCSEEAHSSVEKACKIAMIRLRKLPTDERFRVRGETLKKAFEEDISAGRTPTFVVATLGTTSCCSLDALEEIGEECSRLETHPWLHVDAAYAGNGFVLPELRHLLKGIEHADSFATNPNKGLLVHFDCSALWVRDATKITDTFAVDPLYLQHEHEDQTTDLRHWGIPLSRRFRSLKLWFVFRMYGIKGLQEHFRQHVHLAKCFESFVREDERFEVVNDVHMGLVGFRIKGTDGENKQFLDRLNASGKIFMVPARVKGRFIIRFTVGAGCTTEEDIRTSFQIIASALKIDHNDNTRSVVDEAPNGHIAKDIGSLLSSLDITSLLHDLDSAHLHESIRAS